MLESGSYAVSPLPEGSAPSKVRSNQSVGNDGLARFRVSGHLEVPDSA